jgi:copper resistance protein B
MRAWTRQRRVSVLVLGMAACVATAWAQPSTPTTSMQGDHASQPSPVRPLTDEDRRAAFPDVPGHAVHDTSVNWFVLFDQLEWQGNGDASGMSWDSKGWIGGDRHRIWFRTDGESNGARLDAGDAQMFYGRAVARWWDVIVGVRQDVRPGPSQTWAAVGMQGLAPYRFEVEATAFVGAGGRTQFRVETEYELLVTNRLILQPLLEVNASGRSDRDRGLGAGLNTVDLGLRLRYEFRRELAPYVGVTWQRRLFGTADMARAAGDPTGGARLAVGLRFWM